MKKTAYCKINLTLEILGKQRNDGFHDIRSVMHKIPLGDEIEIFAKDGEGRISFTCDADVCEDKDNLAYRAAEEYLEAYRKNTGKNADVTISLKKVTPFGAGLGGGSADAATVLDMMQKLLGEVSDEEVLEMASRLGSDVPFCLERYMCAYCTGRGEICEPIETLPEGISVVVAKPDESLNTKGIYGEYDSKFSDDYTKSVSDRMRQALADKNFAEVCRNLVNDFESICIPRLSKIDDIKNIMKKLGAACCQMSGSGSAVFGLFDSDEKSAVCTDALKSAGFSDVFRFTGSDFRKMYKGE